jgi:hypothetical protein
MRLRRGAEASLEAVPEIEGGTAHLELVRARPGVDACDREVLDRRVEVPLEQMGAISPGYTANRAVNAIPFVCAAEPGIRTSVELPQIIATLG